MKAAALGLIVCLGFLTLPACGGWGTETPASKTEEPASEPGDILPTELGAGFALVPRASTANLQYVGGHQCVSVEDPIYVYKNKKPKKVRWWVDPAREYYWEIVYDSSKPDAMGDYFGIIDAVGCNDNHTTSRKNSGVPDEPGTYYWPYKVFVYECLDGEKGELLCESPDPRVGIRR